MRQFIKKIVEKVEFYLPMSMGGLLIFVVIIYMFYVVGRSIWINYNFNKDLERQTEEIESLQDQITFMQYQINYYETSSYKEKQAREKLAYRAPGERVVALPIDKPEEGNPDSETTEVENRIANYKLWWQYFFQ